MRMINSRSQTHINRTHNNNPPLNSTLLDRSPSHRTFYIND